MRWTSAPGRRCRARLLVVPLDTHVSRIARHLGLTRRSDLSWRTAEEVTASLRLLDPDDPVRFDFALCHLGMSGACPAHVDARRCRACALALCCATGQRLTAARRPARRGGTATAGRSSPPPRLAAR